YSWKICTHAEEVDDELQMEMRCPIPVFFYPTERPNTITRRHQLSRCQSVQRFTTEMPVERIERRAIIGLVAQNDNRPIILRLRIVGERMHLPTKRRMDWRTGSSEQIDAEMNGAPGEKRSGVDETWLVPTPNAAGDTIHAIGRAPNNAHIEPLPARQIHDRRERLPSQAGDDERGRQQRDASQTRQRTPDRGLTDPKVGVVGPLTLLVRGDAGGRA